MKTTTRTKQLNDRTSLVTIKVDGAIVAEIIVDLQRMPTPETQVTLCHNDNGESRTFLSQRTATELLRNDI